MFWTTLRSFIKHRISAARQLAGGAVFGKFRQIVYKVKNSRPFGADDLWET